MSMQRPKLPFVVYLLRTWPGFVVSHVLMLPSQVVEANLSPEGDRASAQVPSTARRIGD